jgi:type I restriction enzyme R subunit
LGRETKSVVVLVLRLRAALVRVNPVLSLEAINSAMDELARDRSAMPEGRLTETAQRAMKIGYEAVKPNLNTIVYRLYSVKEEEIAL